MTNINWDTNAAERRQIPRQYRHLGMIIVLEAVEPKDISQMRAGSGVGQCGATVVFCRVRHCLARLPYRLWLASTIARIAAMSVTVNSARSVS
jgi:hypothetical protein